MSHVRILDSAGVSLLMALDAIASQQGVSSSVCEIEQYVMRIFPMMKVQRALTIYPTEDVAIRAGLGS